MQIDISGHHVAVTPALRTYTMEKIEKIQRRFNHIKDVHVVLSVDKRFRQCAEAYVELSGKRIFANSLSSDMYAAIDLLEAKLNRQVVRHKEKMKHNNVHQCQLNGSYDKYFDDSLNKAFNERSH